MKSQKADNSKSKLWVVKPAGALSNSPLGKSTNVVCLTCSCQSSECRAIYDAYMEEKAMVKVLQERLAEYSTERSFIVEQVLKQENEHAAKLAELELCMSEQWTKIDGLNKSLENERRLRMEDVYKMEFLKQDNYRLMTENKETRQHHINAVNALPELEKENKLLKQSLLLNKETISKMNDELQQYDYELSKLEDANTRLRLRVSHSDEQIDSIRLSSMKSLGSSQASNLPPLRSVKSMSMVSQRSTIKYARNPL